MLESLLSIIVNDFYDLNKGFPKDIKSEVDTVSSKLSKENTNLTMSIATETFLLAGEDVILPNRCYFKTVNSIKYETFTDLQKKIYACICLLNHNGYTREKYLRYLLNEPLEEWMLPYLLKVSGEYIKELLNILYESLKEADNILLKEFCSRNPKQSERNYSRMTSYWNEYYRFDVTYPCVIDGRQGLRTNIKDYVGYSLFRECWGITPGRKRAYYDNH